MGKTRWKHTFNTAHLQRHIIDLRREDSVVVSESDSWPPRHRRAPELDGLRGVAIALVLALHFAPPPDTRLGYIAAIGWTGVDLFFVLSGFLITGILLDAKGRDGYFRNFYARRALRIFPLYYGMLILMVIAQQFIEPTTWSGGAYIAAHPVWFLTHTENWLIARDPGATTAQLAGLWSLAIEEQFYLVWPVVVAVTSERALLLIGGVVLLLSPVLRIHMAAAGSPIEHLYAVTATRLDPIVAGAIVAVAARRVGLRRCRRPSLYLMGGALLSVEFLIARTGTTAPDSRSFPIMISCLAVFWASTLVLTATSSGRWRRAMLQRPLQWLGRYSYALYLIQTPVHATLGALGLGADNVGQLEYAIIALPICLSAAFASWHLWERRWLALKDRFPRRTAAMLPVP